VVFAAYNNVDRWLQPTDSLTDDTGSRYRVRSRVISASIDEPSGLSDGVRRLLEPVEFVLQHTNVSVQHMEYNGYSLYCREYPA